MNHKDVDYLAFSQVKKEKGCLDTRVIMWKQSEGTYATHYEVMRPAGSGTEYQFIWGHYDMDIFAAMEDFVTRCRSLGVEPGQAEVVDKMRALGYLMKEDSKIK